MRYFSIEFIHIMPSFEEPEDYNPDCDFSASGKFMWELDNKVSKAIKDAGIQIKHEYSFYDGSLYKYVRVDGFEMDASRAVTKALMEADLWHDMRTGYDQEIKLYRVIYLLRMRPVDENIDPMKMNFKTIKEYFDAEYSESA